MKEKADARDRVLRPDSGLKSPCFVADVTVDPEAGQVDVFVEHPRGRPFECGVSCAVYDHTSERQWQHLDTMEFQTILHAKPPRIKCAQHGVKQVNLPWAEKSSRFTILFERVAIAVLQATQTVKGAQEVLGTSWDETWHILKKAVARGKGRKTAKPMPRIGIDEKAFRKGRNYITLIYDLDTSTVEAIADGKGTESGNAYFSRLSADQLKSVEAIAMDMSGAYVRSASKNIDGADKKIFHDQFHVMALLSKAVDNVRRAEHKELTALNDDILKESRYYWLTGFERLTERQKMKLDKLVAQKLETGVAWSFKEMLRDLWLILSKRAATAFFCNW